MEMQGTPPSFVERYFKVREKGSSVRTELLAGLTTFIAMAYILFVNPNILADAGIPKDAAIASTIWIAALASLAMGVFANYPVALAPGMGLNAFFAYYVCGVLGLHWTVALGAVFFSGVLFLILTVGGIRQAIINAVPRDLKLAISVGIGLFIAFIGLKGTGLIVENSATYVALGHVTAPTRISAGAVANAGTSPISGVKSSAVRKSRPAATAVSPVRPPEAMPAALSM